MRPRFVVGVAAVALHAAAMRAPAQDVEIEAAARGIELPQAYYETITRNPDFFAPQGGWIARSRSAAAIGVPVTGDMPLLALLTLFSDSPQPSIDDDDLRRVLFSGPAATGTLREFYAEASGGRLNIAGDAYPWQRTSVTLAEAVGNNFALGTDSHIGDHLLEALTALDASVDFGAFDNDGADNVPNSGDDDGVVDAFAVYFLEVAASCGGPGPWPHFSTISARTGSAFASDDVRPGGGTVRVDPYFIQSAVACDGQSLAGVTTIAHELGHLLNLPDLYHPVDGIQPQQRRWVVGCWSLMAAGSWGCGDVFTGPPSVRPTHPGAWEKQRLGWLDEVQQVSGVGLEQISLPPVQTSGKILEVPMGPDERLLIENRSRIGFDQDLPAAGVLIYRVNETLPFRPDRTAPRAYRVQLLEADGDSALVETRAEGGNRGVAGDAWGAAGSGTLTNLTDPSTRSDAGLGAESDVNIFRITYVGGEATLLISTAPLDIQRLLGPLLGERSDDLTEEEKAFLDGRNNADGRYDVGDLRAYLQRDGRL